MELSWVPKSLGYRTDLAVLELGGSTVEDCGNHLVVRSPHNPNYWWGNFVLLKKSPADSSVPDWLDRFATALPDSSHRAFGVDTTDGSVSELSGFADLGLTVEASAVMTAQTVHQPAHRSDSAVCRTLSSDDDWAQSVDLRIRCDDRDLAHHHAFVTAKTATTRAIVDAGLGQWFGAFLDARLVAQLGLFRAGDGLARYQAVETDPDFRRLGLAGTLVHHAATWGLGEPGITTLVMVADPDYFAIELYRKVGFARTETQLQAERQPPR